MRSMLQLVLLFLCIFVACALGPLCYECDDVAEIAQCHRVVRCHQSEKCYVQKFITSTNRAYYKLGCIDHNTCLSNQTQPMSKRTQDGVEYDSADLTVPDVTSLTRKSRATSGDNVLCLACADDVKDLLTKCGAQPYHGLLCFKCENLLDPHSCDTVQLCSSEEQCFIGLQPSHTSGEFHYTMDCRRSLVCNALHNIPHTIGCLTCCTESLCNYGACDINASTTTSTTTTTTTTTTTPPKPVVTVVGPSSADYNSQVTLHCNTNMPVDSYIWTLDGRLLSTSTSSLVITALNTNTSGQYSCVAFRKGQSGSAELTIRITQRPAHVISVTHNLDLEVSVVTFKCIANGYPFPTIDWSFYGTSGSHTASNLQLNPGHSFGVIFSYTPSVHNGVYTCSARNVVGGDVKTTTLP